MSAKTFAGSDEGPVEMDFSCKVGNKGKARIVLGRVLLKHRLRWLFRCSIDKRG
jgi:hypothetical protein